MNVNLQTTLASRFRISTNASACGHFDLIFKRAWCFCLILLVSTVFSSFSSFTLAASSETNVRYFFAQVDKVEDEDPQEFTLEALPNFEQSPCCFSNNGSFSESSQIPVPNPTLKDRSPAEASSNSNHDESLNAGEMPLIDPDTGKPHSLIFTYFEYQKSVSHSANMFST